MYNNVTPRMRHSGEQQFLYKIVSFKFYYEYPK
jgi:hypothetical protein